MKKLLTILMVLVLACTTVFANGTTESAEAPVEIIVNEEYIGNKNAETVITLAMYKDNSMASPFPEFRDWAYEVQYAWAEKHPDWGIELEYVDATNISVEMSKILSEAEMGVGPDAFHLDSYYVGLFKDAGLLQPLNDVIPQEDLDPFFDWTKQVTVDADGNQIALWGETDARVLYYRNDLMEEPPRTWDELIETASRIHEETGMHGFLTLGGMSEGGSNEGTWPYFWAMGGEIFDETGRPVLGEGENRQKLIDVYSFNKRLVESGASPIDISSYLSFDPINAEVAAGNVAMFLGGTWTVNQLANLVDDPSVWSYTFLPMPEADQYSTTCGGWTWAVLTDDPVKKEIAASFLMDTICGKEGMAKRCEVMGQIPVRTDVFETEYFQNDENMVNFYEQFKIGNTRPASSMYPFVSDINARMLGKVFMGQLTPEQAVDELQKTVLAEWEKNYK